MERLKKHRVLLQALCKATPNTRVAIVQAAPADFIRALISIALGVLHRKIPIHNATLKRLKSKKTAFRKFARCESAKDARTQLTQKGGILPFLIPLIPALIAAGKAAALGAVSAGVGYGVKKGLEKATG